MLLAVMNVTLDIMVESHYIHSLDWWVL